MAQCGLASKGQKFSLFKVGKDLKTAVGPDGGRSAEYKNKGIMAYFHRISGREKEDYRFKTLATDRPLFSNSSPSCKICLLRFPLPPGNSAEGFLRQYYFRNLESFKIISIKTEQPQLFLNTCKAQ